MLGDHVTQKGSLVGPERMRFDFSHPKALTPDEIAAVEDDVNRRIRANGDVATRLMTPEAAVEAGALALFGEKYGEEVRVVSMGPPASGRNRRFLFDRTVRRHPCPPDRRYRPVPHPFGKRGRRRRAAHRSRDRRSGGAAGPQRNAGIGRCRYPR